MKKQTYILENKPKNEAITEEMVKLLVPAKKDGLAINDTTPSLIEVYSSQKVEDELDLIAVEILLKQNIPRLVDANTTALNNEILHVTADATITDVVDAIAGNFFTVRVLSGVATVGGVAYGVGTLITRNYNGTSWTSQVNGRLNTIFSNTIYYLHTGTTALTILGELTIPENTIKDGDVWEVNLAASRNQTDNGSNCIINVFLGSEATPFIRGTQIGNGNLRRAGIIRHLLFKNGNAYKFSNSGGYYHDFASIQSNEITVFDLSITQKISFGLQLSVSTDTANFEYIIFKKIN